MLKPEQILRLESLPAVLQVQHRGTLCILLASDEPLSNTRNILWQKKQGIAHPFGTRWNQHCETKGCVNPSHFYPASSMATLENLPIPSLSDLTDEEIEQRLLALRADRRAQMARNVTRRKLKPKEAPKRKELMQGRALDNLLADLSKEELEKLKAMLTK